LHIGLLLGNIQQQTTEIHQCPEKGVTNYFQRRSFAGQAKIVAKMTVLIKLLCTIFI
jgi:hypothetical protein